MVTFSLIFDLNICLDETLAVIGTFAKMDEPLTKKKMCLRPWVSIDIYVGKGGQRTKEFKNKCQFTHVNFNTLYIGFVAYVT